MAVFEAHGPHHPWRCWCGLCLHRRVRSGLLRAGVGLGQCAWPRVAGQLAPGPLDPGKPSVLRPDVCALPPLSALLCSFRVWQLVGAGLSMGTELPRWGSSLRRDGQRQLLSRWAGCAVCLPQVSTPTHSFWTGWTGPGYLWFLCGGRKQLWSEAVCMQCWLCCLNRRALQGSSVAQTGRWAPPAPQVSCGLGGWD